MIDTILVEWDRLCKRNFARCYGNRDLKSLFRQVVAGQQ